MNLDIKKMVIPVDGQDYKVVVQGQGVPVFLFHGLGGSVSDWDSMIAHLPGSYQFIKIHLRGIYLSKNKPTILEQMETLTQLMKQTLIILNKPHDSFHIVSTSYGSILSLEVKKSFAEQANSLVLINPLLPFPIKKMKFNFLKLLLRVSPYTHLFSKIMRSTSGLFLLKKVGRIFNVSFDHVQSFKDLDFRKVSLIQNTIVRFGWLLNHHNWRHYLKSLKKDRTPILVVFGSQDELFQKSSYQSFAKKMGYQWQCIDGGAHLMLQSKAPELAQSVSRFFDSRASLIYQSALDEVYYSNLESKVV